LKDRKIERQKDGMTERWKNSRREKQIVGKNIQMERLKY
jgi:hypothetical protein